MGSKRSKRARVKAARCRRVGLPNKKKNGSLDAAASSVKESSVLMMVDGNHSANGAAASSSLSQKEKKRGRPRKHPPRPSSSPIIPDDSVKGDDDEEDVDALHRALIDSAFSSLSAPLSPSKRRLARHNRTMRLESEKELSKLEKQIYILEDSYLKDTARETGGNAVKGWSWSAFKKKRGASNGPPVIADRLFSLSSFTSPAAAAASARGDANASIGLLRGRKKRQKA